LRLLRTHSPRCAVKKKKSRAAASEASPAEKPGGIESVPPMQAPSPAQFEYGELPRQGGLNNRPAVSSRPPTADRKPDRIVDPGAELDSLLCVSDQDQRNRRAGPQSFFCEGGSWRCCAGNPPPEEERNLAKISSSAGRASARCFALGGAGNYFALRAQRRRRQATAFYQKLLDDFPKATTLLFSPTTGLGGSRCRRTI